MYLYIDKDGVIKERINDKTIRQGSNDYNKIFIHIEDDNDIDNLSTSPYLDMYRIIRLPNGTTTTEESFISNVTSFEIPYDKERDTKFFKNYTTYKFYYFSLSDTELEDSGLAYATVRIINDDNTINTLGVIPFEIEGSVINYDNRILYSQYDYLLSYFAEQLERKISYANYVEVDTYADLPETGDSDKTYVTLDDNKNYQWSGTQYVQIYFTSRTEDELDTYINTTSEAYIDGKFAEFHPEIFNNATETEITALTENGGIYVASDTGYIWVWSDTNGVYEQGALLYDAQQVAMLNSANTFTKSITIGDEVNSSTYSKNGISYFNGTNTYTQTYPEKSGTFIMDTDLSNLASDIIPSEASTYNLGSSDYKWRYIHSNGAFVNRIVPSTTDYSVVGGLSNPYENGYFTNIELNGTDLTTTLNDLQTQITSNDTDIATNVSNISDNATNIATNTSDISDILDGTQIVGKALLDSNGDNIYNSLTSLQSQIDTVRGIARSYGQVNYNTEDVTQAILNAHVLAIKGANPTNGDLVYDLDNHQWEFNGNIWVDNGEWKQTSIATDTELGVVKASDDVSVNATTGAMTVNNSAKLGGISGGVGAGVNSIKFGENSIATGTASTAVGRGAQAKGNIFTTAIGESARATEDEATAIGKSAQATGAASTAIGEFAHATGEGATAMGGGANATGSYSVAIGFGSQTYIPYWVNFDTETYNRTIALNSPSELFFRNENVDTSKTSRDDYTNGKSLQFFIDALDNRLSLVEALIKPTYYFVESVDTFITRETAEGQNIIDGSNATINSITGHSKVSTNLLNIETTERANSGISIYLEGNTLTVSGTASITITFWAKLNTALSPGTYIGNDIGESNLLIRVAKELADYNNRVLFSTGIPITTSFTSTYLAITVPEGATVNGTYNLMLNESIKSATATKITSDTGFKKIEVGDTISNFCITNDQAITLFQSTDKYPAQFSDTSNDIKYVIHITSSTSAVLEKRKISDNSIIETNNFYGNYSYILEYPSTCDKNATPNLIQTNTGSSLTYPTDLTFPTSEFPIPAEIQALPGYGVEGNIVDFKNGTYTQNNEVVDNEIVALATPVVTDISEYIVGDTYKVWANGTETFDSDVAPTLDSTYFVSRITEVN